MFTTLEKPKNKARFTNFRAVAIDETHHITDDALVKACGKIFTVYFYDANEKTHCCEITPSHYLIPLYCYSENEVSDEIKDELTDLERYNEPMYVHCHQLEDMKTVKVGCNGRYYAPEGRKHKEILDHAEEYLRGNWPI